MDLAAIVANWRDLRARHAPGAVAGVAKADAYGLGAAPVARALRDAGCRVFFVAHLGEGVALRAALGPGPVVAVLNGFPPGADGDAALAPVLNGLGDVDAWAAAARRDGRPRDVLLHLDTGMARLGLDAREAAALLGGGPAARLAGLRVLWAMTHFARADEPDHPANAAQAARFAALCDRLPPGLPRSLANSSGLFLPGGIGRSDLARPGCALYGINPTPGAPNPMRQVVALDAPVLQVREVAAGEAVGYGGTWVAARPSRIATVAAGYADGYARALSGRGARGRLGGRDVPLVGRVSMDLTAFDVTDLPHPPAPGARLTLLGDGITPDEVAARAGTIGYEVLTSLGSRYARDHLPAAAA